MKFDLKTRRIFGVCLALIIMAAAITWYFHRNKAIEDFSCVASLSQHYSNDSLNVSVSYTFHGNTGIVSLSGRSQTDATKVFNRKVSFIFNKEKNIYHMTSQYNLKFPDDNVDDAWLNTYEPDFFVYPEKSIYMQITPLITGNYLFMIDTIPTYICKSL